VTETTYTYDLLSRLQTVTASWRNAIDIADETTQYNYDVSGGLDGIKHANGMIEDHDFDTHGRVDEITHFDDANNDGILDAGETILAQFAYQYDAVVNRTQAIETLNSQTRTFTWAYDHLNRLVEETLTASDLDDYTHTFSYDLASNRVEKVVDSTNDTLDETITYTHDGNDRLLTETSTLGSTTTYGYNEAGDQISKTDASGTTNFRFDADGRLIGIDTNNDGTDEITYQYNAQGLRVSKTHGSDTTTYHYDLQNPTGYAKAIEELLNGVLQRSYTFGHRVVSQWDAADGTIHLHHDIHGSARAVLSTAKAVLETYTYSAFGDGLGFDEGTAKTTWLFAGDGQYDNASGLIYHLERWRNGHRFVSVDPSGLFTLTSLVSGLGAVASSIMPRLAVAQNALNAASPLLYSVVNLTWMIAAWAKYPIGEGPLGRPTNADGVFITLDGTVGIPLLLGMATPFSSNAGIQLGRSIDMVIFDNNPSVAHLFVTKSYGLGSSGGAVALTAGPFWNASNIGDFEGTSISSMVNISAPLFSLQNPLQWFPPAGIFGTTFISNSAKLAQGLTLGFGVSSPGFSLRSTLNTTEYLTSVSTSSLFSSRGLPSPPIDGSAEQYASWASAASSVFGI